MFGEIARRYDLMNCLLSGGMDRRWRRRTVRLVPPTENAPVLDVCTGTADLALAYWRAGGGRVKVVGADFCRPMLLHGADKCQRAEAQRAVLLVEADAQQLPFADDTFQVVSVAFGLRNLSDPDRGLREMTRVCRPGGRVAVLEFGFPQSRPWRGLYSWYVPAACLPRVGELVARNRQSAYNYLPTSVSEFPQREALLARMQSAGLRDAVYRPFTFGIAGLYVGIK